MTSFRLGEGLLLLAMLVWLSAAVGPWWLGLVLFLAAWAVNAIQLAKRP